MNNWLRLIFGSHLTLRHFAWLTIAASLALSVIGIYCIDVATVAEPAPGLSGPAMRQAVYLVVGIAGAFFVALPDYRIIRVFAWPALWVVLALLVFLLIPFVPTWLVRPYNGARSWINFGFMDFQPAEVAKIAYVLVMADYLRFRRNHRTFLGLLPPALITFIPVGLITLQPDLGSASLFIPALGAMLVAAGAKLKHLVIIVLLAALAGPAAYPLLQDHQKERIVGLVNLIRGSSEGHDTINYQSITAMTLAGAGEVTGLPDPLSRAVVHYNYLPERENDMIVAVVLNRFGLIGGLSLLALYGLWFLGAFATAAISREPFARLVIVGLIAIIAAQMFINLGMALGFLPIIGITLPYVSHGGSSMLTVWLITGLILNIAMRPDQRLLRPAFEFRDEEEI